MNAGSAKRMNKLLKVSYVTAIIGFLLLQYASATQADDGTTPSKSGYSVPARLEPQRSTDGKTLYNAVPPVVYVVDPNPSHPPLHIRAAFDVLTLPPEFATATFSITYVPEGDTDLWGETCYTFPDGAKAALNGAASIWGNTVQSSVPIAIKACWANLSGGMLGYSGGGPLHSDFDNAPLPNTFYTGALANALAGYDIMPTKWDMHITYSLNFSWYVGTDGNTPPGQFDLVSVALHEMGHGLGFAGSMTYSGGQGSWGFYGMPTIYDTFVRDNSGNQLINTGIYGNPSTALGSALTSNNIYFHGSNAMAANGGQRAKVYAPSTWAEGSSYSHLDYGTFGGTSNRLMVYAITAGDSIHDPGPVTIGLLTDLGWVTSISPCEYSVSAEYSSLFSKSGGTGSFSVTTQPGCAWTATEGLDWASITSGASGTGSGTVTYTVSSNAGGERSGTITVSGESFTGTHTITQAGTGETNALQNPGFESGNTVWVQESGSSPIISQSSGTPVSAHTGNWLTWFGGYANANDVLYQQVTLPSWACQAYVQFWYWIETEETSGQNDTLSVEIRRNSDNTLLRTLETLSNLDSTPGWVQSEPLDVTEFIGQTVRLRFAAATNATNTTNFFIDDVSVMVMSAEDMVYVKWDGECAGKSPCYSSVQSAVDGANTCSIINTTEDTYDEDVVLSTLKNVILQGGWDSTFTMIQSNTTIPSLNVTSGTLAVGNLIIR